MDREHWEQDEEWLAAVAKAGEELAALKEEERLAQEYTKKIRKILVEIENGLLANDTNCEEKNMSKEEIGRKTIWRKIELGSVNVLVLDWRRTVSRQPMFDLGLVCKDQNGNEYVYLQNGTEKTIDEATVITYRCGTVISICGRGVFNEIKTGNAAIAEACVEPGYYGWFWRGNYEEMARPTNINRGLWGRFLNYFRREKT